MGRKKDNDDLRTRRQLDELKWQTAQQLGLDDDLKDPDELSVREAGKIGGNMVKKLIKKGEEAIANGGGRIARENIADKQENQKR
jgi:Small, acid-soluble spore proteins, alpha/beta type.